MIVMRKQYDRYVKVVWSLRESCM